jgi:hypothetical protein
MAGRNFYRGTDAEIVAGSAAFASMIATGFASYGLTSAQQTAFAALNTTLQAAYLAAVSPSTRTPGAIQGKNTAIREMRANAILLSKIIYATPTVTDEQLVDLGLLPRPSRAAVPPPDSAPVIDIESVRGNTVTLRLHEAGDSSRRGKPAGVSGAALYSFCGAVAPTDEAGWTFEGLTSKVKTSVSFPNTVAPGSKVWFTAFWFNERKQNGPAADSVTTNLQGGGAMAA